MYDNADLEAAADSPWVINPLEDLELSPYETMREQLRRHMAEMYSYLPPNPPMPSSPGMLLSELFVITLINEVFTS